MNNPCFYPSDILLPDFHQVPGEKWATIACDQFTSEPAYWEEAQKFVGDNKSTLSLFLPEVYLNEAKERLPKIALSMKEYKENVLKELPFTMILVERKQNDGRTRFGIVGMVDLEEFDYHEGAKNLIRSTEKTVLERIPPRVEIRRNASIELPHILLLVDDDRKTVIEPLVSKRNTFEVLYDFDLMMDGGHITGYKIPAENMESCDKALASLLDKNELQRKYGKEEPLLLAVGDGNHSLSSAKAFYEEIKEKIGPEKAKLHPARFALCEIENIHDDALSFEPIYRVLYHVNANELFLELQKYIDNLHGNAAMQTLHFLTKQEEGDINIVNPEAQLPVATLQIFLDQYKKNHPEMEIDYIHGEDSLVSLVKEKNAIGFLFEGMKKNELFRTVIYDGALPRKTFSMGHAKDKRYYIEARSIL